MHRQLLLLAVSLISSLADTRVACPYASTCQGLNAMGGSLPSQAVHRDPPTILSSLGLTPQQMASIDAGRPVAKVLDWGGASEVYVFGGVHIHALPDAYLMAARDVERLKGAEGYLGVGELTEHTSAADLAALTVDPDDVKAVKNCRDGSCDVQLPTASIQAFHDAVNWSRADVGEQVNALARQMLLDLVRAYRDGGNDALGEYRDKQHPARVAAQFETMLSRASALPDVLPELRRYLLRYPNADLPGADSFFYWEKVAFGMKPTIRANHAVIYRGRTDNREFAAVAIKQLYASHYFHTALDMSVCVDDGAAQGPRGFYLLTLKGSQQEGLTGVKGSMLRKIVVDKTRSSLERALASIARTLEQAPHD